jgi:hypothetical protein
MHDRKRKMRSDGVTDYTEPHRFEEWYSWRNAERKLLSTCAACGRDRNDELHDMSEAAKLAGMADRFSEPKEFARYINIIRRMDKDSADHMAMWAEQTMAEYPDHSWWLGRVAQECWRRIETFPREVPRRRRRLYVLAD